MRKGDKVALNGKEEVTGIIENSRLDSVFGANYCEHYVRYDDTDLVPQADWHEEKDLVMMEDLPMGEVQKVVCECGVDSVMVNGKHSDYCALYRSSYD